MRSLRDSALPRLAEASMALDEADPEVSVVVTTRNRPDRLERLLFALGGQDFDGTWEAIIVDDCSEPATGQLLARVAAKQPFSLRTVRTDTQLGPGGGRNEGWRLARAPLVAFTDDDCEPTQGWLSSLVAGSRNEPTAIVQGATVSNPRDNYSGAFTRTLNVTSLGPWYPMANMAFPTRLLKALGGFDDTLPRGEDTDLAWRAIEAGHLAVFAPDAIVHHAVMDLGAVAKLRVAAAWTPAFRNFKQHPRLREELIGGIFWKQSHALLLAPFLAGLLTRRKSVTVVSAIPYLRDVAERMKYEGAPYWQALFYPVHDAVEMGAALTGSVRAGTLVL